MSTQTEDRLSHSADVRIRLSLDGHVLTIGHLAPDYVVLDEPIDYPPADAEIVMSVDGQERRWRVRLANGIAVGEPRTVIVQLQVRR